LELDFDRNEDVIGITPASWDGAQGSSGEKVGSMIDAAIAMSIHDTGMPLVDLTDDGEAGPSGAVKDDTVDKPDERGKQDVVDDAMYSSSTTTSLGTANIEKTAS
jgi:hypothetical protein